MNALSSGPILVTGGEGQVARALEAVAASRVRQRAVRRVGRPAFDFDAPDTIAAVLNDVHPAVVVNAAAYTAVDKAETDADAAWRANRDGPALIAAWCAAAGVPLIHISTDYVFDGTKGSPYVETDATNPQGVYGASKLAGEQAVLAAAPAIVLRTSWVYAAAGKNFVLTMLNAARKLDRLRVVADQRGCPTAAEDLAGAILGIVDRLADDGWNDAWSGIYHAAGSGETTWHGLAMAVFQASAQRGGKVPDVEAISTSDWPTPARRPQDSRLDCTKLTVTFGQTLPDWRESVARVVDLITV